MIIIQPSAKESRPSQQTSPSRIVSVVTKSCAASRRPNDNSAPLPRRSNMPSVCKIARKNITQARKWKRKSEKSGYACGNVVVWVGRIHRWRRYAGRN